MMPLTASPAPTLSVAPPVRRRLATLFVDIANSTSLLMHHPAEVVLGVVQGFMSLVTEVSDQDAGEHVNCRVVAAAAGAGGTT